eukprot:367533_1
MDVLVNSQLGVNWNPVAKSNVSQPDYAESIHIDEDSTLGEFRKQICERFDIEFDECVLRRSHTSRFSLKNDTKPIKFYGIKNKSKIYVEIGIKLASNERIVVVNVIDKELQQRFAIWGYIHKVIGIKEIIGNVSTMIPNEIVELIFQYEFHKDIEWNSHNYNWNSYDVIDGEMKTICIGSIQMAADIKVSEVKSTLVASKIFYGLLPAVDKMRIREVDNYSLWGSKAHTLAKVYLDDMTLAENYKKANDCIEICCERLY